MRLATAAESLNEGRILTEQHQQICNRILQVRPATRGRCGTVSEAEIDDLYGVRVSYRRRVRIALSKTRSAALSGARTGVEWHIQTLNSIRFTAWGLRWRC